MFLSGISQADLEDFTGIMVVIAIVFVIILVSMIVAGVAKGSERAKELTSDDDKTLFVVKGTVKEKSVDSKTENLGAYKYESKIEWFIIEDENGNRRQLRNVKPKEILIANNDRGEFLVRGETIYRFTREQ